MRVVVVDDEADIRLLTALAMTARHDVVELEDGLQAIEYDGWAKVDVAVIDVMMPGASGDEVLAWLQEHHPHVRRVICTAKPIDALEGERFAAAHDVVPKPFDPDTLRVAVER